MRPILLFAPGAVRSAAKWPLRRAPASFCSVRRASDRPGSNLVATRQATPVRFSLAPAGGRNGAETRRHGRRAGSARQFPAAPSLSSPAS